ncbi:MAG: NAD(P)-dependent oxidoreductase [Candidatus Omnitrophica bacterium]|nr:NAD(P)-dependent oxidoreductase [Candidatus Omnitrophota bacterium]
MKVLITGATGFIGKALVEKLISTGNEIFVLTRQREKAEELFKDKVIIVESDISHKKFLKYLELREVDSVIHLASNLDYFGTAYKLFKINVRGTVNLLNWTKIHRIKKFIYISSIEAVGPVREEDIPARMDYSACPVSPYGVSKLKAEKEVIRFSKINNLRSIILRLGNVYGPGKQNFVISLAKALISKDKSLRFLFFCKNRIIHPIYIDDAIEGIIASLNKENIQPEVYIIAGNQIVTMERLFIMIGDYLGLKIKFSEQQDRLLAIYLKGRQYLHRFLHRADFLDYLMSGRGRRVHRGYSIEETRKALNFYPKVDLKEGIKLTLDWAKKEGFLYSGKEF